MPHIYTWTLNSKHISLSTLYFDENKPQINSKPKWQELSDSFITNIDTNHLSYIQQLCTLSCAQNANDTIEQLTAIF